jgi:hypothetical protein
VLETLAHYKAPVTLHDLNLPLNQGAVIIRPPSKLRFLRHKCLTRSLLRSERVSTVRLMVLSMVALEGATFSFVTSTSLLSSGGFKVDATLSVFKLILPGAQV